MFLTIKLTGIDLTSPSRFAKKFFWLQSIACEDSPLIGSQESSSRPRSFDFSRVSGHGLIKAE